MIPPVLAAVYFGSPYFDTLIGVGSLIMIGELFRVCDRRMNWTLAGAAYVGVAAYGLVHLRSAPVAGLETMVWLFSLVWASDTGAYLVGRAIGGAKLAPRISPNKTWAGFIGALAFAGSVGFGCAVYMDKPDIWPIIVFSSLLGAISQCGDLLESWVKRRFHKKDMSGLIPGHGGLFDRADGLLAAAIVTWLTTVASGRRIMEWL